MTTMWRTGSRACGTTRWMPRVRWSRTPARVERAAGERVAQRHLAARDLGRLDVVHAQRARRVRAEHGLEHEARVTGQVLDEGGGPVEARAVERRLAFQGLLAAPHRVPLLGRDRGDALEGPE